MSLVSVSSGQLLRQINYDPAGHHQLQSSLRGLTPIQPDASLIQSLTNFSHKPRHGELWYVEVNKNINCLFKFSQGRLVSKSIMLDIFRHLRRLCPSINENEQEECRKMCSNVDGLHAEICRSFLETTTAAATSLVTSTVSALTSTVTNTLQAPECVPGLLNSSLDSAGSLCSNTSTSHGDGVTIQDCGPSCWPAPFGMVLTVLIAVSMAVCIVVTTFGNLLVIVSFAVDRQIRQPTNYFICSLAVTDVLIGTVSMPFYTVSDTFQQNLQNVFKLHQL